MFTFVNYASRVWVRLIINARARVRARYSKFIGIYPYILHLFVANP
mgnify:CR=1 FL=1